MRDPAGFGGTDYFATVYTDIDDGGGHHGRHSRRPQQGHAAQGALSVDTSRSRSGVTTVAAGGISADSTVLTSVPIERHLRRHQPDDCGDRRRRALQPGVLSPRSGPLLLPLDVS